MATQSIEDKLKSLYNLQTIDARLDELRALRGELPIEVTDLEDEITGLETRLDRIKQEIEDLTGEISAKKLNIGDSEKLIAKYNEQLNSVKNNREFEALNKEIEIQGLEILASEKKIKEFSSSIEAKNTMLEEVQQEFDGRNEDLKTKRQELKDISEETEKEEEKIGNERQKALKKIEDKLQKAYKRIRANVRNGVAIAPVIRGACGGCFAKIPPQLQSDIRQRKKIVICEHCGRINVDAEMAGIEENLEEEKPKKRSRRKSKA